MHSSSTHHSSFELGDVIPGTRYRVLQPVGEGGAVYRVEHLELGRPFVLKLLRAELMQRPELVQRARVAWQALSRLRHPNIVRVTDAGATARGVPYYVTEQLHGETLCRRLLRRHSLAVPEALGIAGGLASALVAAHAIGVVHGNLEPKKVFLPSRGGTKLFDFGSAEPDGELVRADAYGVGLALFEMIAGRPAFGSARARRGRRTQDGKCPRPLAEVVPGVSGALSELVARLLAPEPRDRPSLVRAIEELRCLRHRYELQVSTTQETAHYVTRRLPLLADTELVPSELGVIVPLPSQTLEGIPWTVTHAAEPRPEPPPTPASAPELTVPPRAPDATAPRPAGMHATSPRVARAPRPARTARRLGLLGVRLMLVMSSAFLGGVAVASLARRSIVGAVDATESDRPPACSRRAEAGHLHARVGPVATARALGRK